MRIIPFPLFHIWCYDTTNNKALFNVGICILIVWETVCCRIATRIWSMKYEISDGLMNPNGFLGGIFYCITGLFTSYYMSELSFNFLCSLIMLIRYTINSAAFIVFFYEHKLFIYKRILLNEFYFSNENGYAELFYPFNQRILSQCFSV